MEKVTAFRASDGALFEDDSQCERHEISLKWKAKIDAFIDSDSSPYTSSPPQQRALIRNVVVAWESFKVKNPNLVEA